MSWSAVPGASHYTVEICRDAACGAVLARATAVPQAALTLPVQPGLPPGEVFWRVTAVAPSGLDGFPSRSIRVEAVDTVRPPAPSLTLQSASGDAVAPESCLADLPRPVVRAVDRRGGELPWNLVLDGREISLAEFEHLPLAGAHQIATRVTDDRGRSADSPKIGFTLDAAAPWVDLLATSIGAASTSEEESAAAPQRRSRKSRKETAPVAACDTGLEYRDAGGTWQSVPCAVDGALPAASVALDPSHPDLELRAPGGAILLGDKSSLAEDALRLSSWDVGCGVTRLALRIVPSPYRAGRMLLEVEVADAAGNRRVQGWHVARHLSPRPAGR
jgi:hypothetical protein